MKKFTMAMLLALLGVGFVACDDDKDDDKGDNKDEKVSCEKTTCTASDANASGVAKVDGDSCKCEFSCKEGYKPAAGSSSDENIKCEKDEEGGSSQKEDCSTKTCTAADANATGVAKADGDSCKCEFSCNNGYKLADGSKNDETIKCEFILLENGASCNGNNECKSGNCASANDEGDGVCAEKEEETGAKACEKDSECDSAKGEYCVSGLCKTASDFSGECSTDNGNFCVGNSLVVCNDGGGMATVAQYSVTACGDNAVCGTSPKNIVGCFDACTEEKAETKKCDTSDPDEDYGYRAEIIYVCTKVDGKLFSVADRVQQCGMGQTCGNSSAEEEAKGCSY